MIKLAGALVLMCLAFGQSSAQPNGIDNVIGKNYKLRSEVLEEEREIQIYLPDDYHNSSIKYPVLYVIDGQRYFLHGITFQQTFRFQDKTPPFIVVGVKTHNRKRRTLFYQESPKFIEYLKEELTPYIDNNYRTLNERIYFGWEMAGGLATQIFAEHPELFQAYLISSPTHISEERTKAVEESLNTNDSLNSFFYITLGTVEAWALESTNGLAKLFKDKAPNQLSWKYDLLPNEDHYSTPLITINNGLKHFFKDYSPIRFYSIEEFNKFGGLEMLYKHYQKRGVRYGISTDIHEDTKHFLLLQSTKEDDIKSFDSFMDEFVGYLDSYNRDMWHNRYGQFYLKHNVLEKALNLFQEGLNKFPESSLLYSGIGDVHSSIGNKDKAIRSYEKALSYDPSLVSAIEGLKKLKH